LSSTPQMLPKEDNRRRRQPVRRAEGVGKKKKRGEKERDDVLTTALEKERGGGKEKKGGVSKRAIASLLTRMSARKGTRRVTGRPLRKEKRGGKSGPWPLPSTEKKKEGAKKVAMLYEGREGEGTSCCVAASISRQPRSRTSWRCRVKGEGGTRCGVF